MDSVLKLRVVEDAYHILDDEDLDELDKVFRSLLDDTTTPTIAAQALTDHIAENAKSRVQKLSSVSEQQRQVCSIPIILASFGKWIQLTSTGARPSRPRPIGRRRRHNCRHRQRCVIRATWQQESGQAT